MTNYDKRRLLKALRIAVAAAQSNGVDPWTLRVPLAVLSDAPDEPFSELPQLDDGAALRLAAKMWLTVDVGGSVHPSRVEVRSLTGRVTTEPHGEDVLAAVRRAIFRAAASEVECDQRIGMFARQQPQKEGESET